MSDTALPHFHNSLGLEEIRVGSRAFMCLGVLPPLDHPHIFLDLGGNDSISCPYCSTRFFYDASLKEGDVRPVESLFVE